MNTPCRERLLFFQICIWLWVPVRSVYDLAQLRTTKWLIAYPNSSIRLYSEKTPRGSGLTVFSKLGQGQYTALLTPAPLAITVWAPHTADTSFNRGYATKTENDTSLLYNRKCKETYVGATLKRSECGTRNKPVGRDFHTNQK